MNKENCGNQDSASESSRSKVTRSFVQAPSQHSTDTTKSSMIEKHIREVQKQKELLERLHREKMELETQLQ